MSCGFYFHLKCSCNSWFTPPFDQSVVSEIGRHWHKGHSMHTETDNGFPFSVSLGVVAKDMIEKHMISVGCVQYIQAADWPVYKNKLDAPMHPKWDTNSFWNNNYDDDLADAMKYTFKKGSTQW